MYCRLWLFSLSFFILLTACTKEIRPTPAALQKDASIEELIALYQKRVNETTGFKALMEVTANLGNRGRHTFQASLHAHNNQRQIRGFDLFGGTLFDLRLSGRFFSLSIPSERKTLRGKLDQFEALAGEKIPSGLINLLEWVTRSGLPEVPFADTPALQKEQHFFTLYLFSTDGNIGWIRQKLQIERNAFRVQQVDLFDLSGSRQTMIKLDHYQKVEGRDFPFSVEGHGPGGKIILKFKEVIFDESTLQKSTSMDRE